MPESARLICSRGAAGAYLVVVVVVVVDPIDLSITLKTEMWRLAQRHEGTKDLSPEPGV